MPDYNAIQKLDQQVQQSPPQTNVNDIYPTLTSSQLDNQGRYPVFHLGLDNEDIYAQQQGTLSKWVNGLGKGLAITGTTAVAGTAGLINGVYQWAKDGKFSSFYDNPMTQKIDQISQNLENQLPNYQSKEEADSKWYSPKTYLTANFWADNVLKNAGFSAGSILSGLAWGKVGSMLSGLSKVAATGALAEVGANSSVESALLARDAGAIEQLGASASDVAKRQLSFDKIKDIGTNLVRAGFSTVGEASMEALQAKNQYKDFITKEYQDKFGTAPIGTELDKINSEADKVGNFTMGANVALLTATNYIQFPKMVGRLWSGDKIAAQAGIGALELVDEAGQAVERGTANAFKQGVRYQAVQGTKGILGGLKTGLKVGGSLFAESEAFEEGAQYVIPIAAQDYFNKGRTGQAQSVSDSLGTGLKSLWNDRQGMLAVISGGISGGLMEAGNPFHREGFLGGIRNRGLDRSRTENFARSLDGVMAGSGYMDQAISSLNRDQELNSDADKALRNNNRLQYEDSRTDINLNYMIPRIQYGRHDLIQDDLMGMRNVASSEQGYADLIKNGVVSDTVSRESFIDNIDKLSLLADSVNTNYKYLTSKYSGIVEKDENGQSHQRYSDDVLGKMAYVGAKIDDYNTRIPQLNGIFTPTTINISGLMESVHENGIGEATDNKFKEVLDQIDAIRGVSPEIKDEMRTNAADLVELSARREFKIREYEQMKNNPHEWEDEAKQFSFAADGEPDMSKVNFNKAEPEETPGDHKAIFDLVSAQANGETPTQDQTDLREKYPNLYEQLTGTVEASRFQAQKDQAQQEGWYQDSNGNPVAPTSKSNFYDANQGDYTMRVNGTEREGTLGYDPDTNSLFLQYDDNGTGKQVEVFNEDFNDGTISKDSPVIDTGYLSEEDTSAPNRVQVRVGELINEISERQTQVQNQIDSQLKELSNIVDEIKAQDKDAKEFTKDYVETMSTLSDMKTETESAYTNLIQERADLEASKDELQALIATPPVTLKSSIDLMQRQQADLESLAAHNGILIPQMQDLAKSATNILTRLGKKIISRMASMAGIPASPNINRVRQAFDRWNTSGSDEDLRTAVNAVQQEYQAIQNFEVRPLAEQDIKYINDQVAKMQDQIRDIDQRVKAKDTVAKRLQDLDAQVIEREEIVRKTPAEPVSEYPETIASDPDIDKELSDLKSTETKFLDDRQKELEFEGQPPEQAQKQAKTEWSDSQEGKRTQELQTVVTTPEVFGDDSERTPISRYFNSTVLLPKSMRNKEYDQRLNVFLNKIGIFDRDRRPNLRLVAVTRQNEESLGLKGFVEKYFKVTDSFDKASNTTVTNDNPVNAPIGMVVAEMVNGNITFIDKNGERLSGVALLDKVLVTKMKAASLTWSTGETAYSDPTGLGEHTANAKREEFEEQRSAILKAQTPALFTFRTSQGRSREASASESPNLVGTLISEETMKQKSSVIEVIRPDQGKNTKTVPGTMEGETVQVKSGTILLRTDDVLQKLNIRKLTAGERAKVKDALIYIVNNRENPSETLNKMRTYLEGSTFLRFGANMETVTINKAKFNLTDENVSGTNFKQAAATQGIDNILKEQNTNVREGLIKSNKAFSEYTGMEAGEPQFKDWATYQEYILSDEDGHKPLVYAPIMVDKYLVFSPEKKAEEVVIKPKKSPEVTADTQVTVTGVTKSKEVVNGQTDLIKTVTNYFTRANEEGISPEVKAQEKEKASAASAVILRMATVMVNRGIYGSVDEVYKALNFSGLLSKLNKGTISPTNGKPKISATDVVDYNTTEKNKYKPSEQLRFGQGLDYEAVVLVGDSGLLELSSLSSKQRKAQGAKNPVPLTSVQYTRMKELEAKLGISGSEVNNRLKEIAKEVRSATVEKIVKVDFSTKSSDPGITLQAGDNYTDQNGNKRVRGDDPNDDKAYDVYTKFGVDAKADDIPGATTTATKLSNGEDVILKNPDAVAKAKSNPLINGTQTEEGYKITGAIDPQSMQWVGVPSETVENEAITVDNVPQGSKPAVSMIEGGQSVIDSISGTADISTVLREVSKFYEAQALTPEEKTTLQEEANTSLGKEATPEEVSEFLAGGFETYIRNETAPENKTLGQTTEVKGQQGKLLSVFKAMRQYLVDIYDSIVGSAIDIKLSAPMKQLYQDMLGIGFADRETTRKKLNKEVFPKSLTGESFAPQMDTNEFTKGRNYKILGANSGNTISVTVKSGDQSISVPKGQVAVRDSITKEIKIVDISKVLSQLPDERTDKVVRQERKARKEKVSDVVEIPEEFEEIDAPLPPSEIISQRVTSLEEQTAIPKQESAPITKKPTKAKAPTATVDGLKTFASPEDTKGGVFLKDGEAVYVLPYYGDYVQVSEDVFKAYNKAVASKAPTEITKSRSLNNIKVGSTVSLSQKIDGVEQEKNYEVIKSGRSEVTVRDAATGQEIDIENVSMKTGEAAALNQQVKQALLNKYIGDTFKDINKFLNPNPTTIQDDLLPNLPIQC